MKLYGTIIYWSWWRLQMETFSALLALCAGNSPVTSEFTSQRPVTRSFDVSLICALNKRLTEQSSGWWFVTPSFQLWRHCNAVSLALGQTTFCMHIASLPVKWTFLTSAKHNKARIASAPSRMCNTSALYCIYQSLVSEKFSITLINLETFSHSLGISQHLIFYRWPQYYAPYNPTDNEMGCFCHQKCVLMARCGEAVVPVNFGIYF